MEDVRIFLNNKIDTVLEKINNNHIHEDVYYEYIESDSKLILHFLDEYIEIPISNELEILDNVDSLKKLLEYEENQIYIIINHPKFTLYDTIYNYDTILKLYYPGNCKEQVFKRYASENCPSLFFKMNLYKFVENVILDELIITNNYYHYIKLKYL